MAGGIGMKEIGLVIRERRKAVKMTQQELADKAGVSRRHVAAIEAGTANPTLWVTAELSKVLNMSVDAVIYDLDDLQTEIAELQNYISQYPEEVQALAIDTVKFLCKRIN